VAKLARPESSKGVVNQGQTSQDDTQFEALGMAQWESYSVKSIAFTKQRTLVGSRIGKLTPSQVVLPTPFEYSGACHPKIESHIECAKQAEFFRGV
jgi:hypothetical protein